MFNMPVYAAPEPHFALEDLKLSMGNDLFREFESWFGANVPVDRRLKDGVLVSDVDHFFMYRRRITLS